MFGHAKPQILTCPECGFTGTLAAHEERTLRMRVAERAHPMLAHHKPLPPEPKNPIPADRWH